MDKTRKLVLAGLMALAVLHCLPARAASGKSVWFQGSVAEAFALAGKQNRPVFLYWGAVWCPPCSEIKSEVFAKPGFAGLMQSFIPVYLDGDTERAQIWGEKLGARGYPTILVLNPDGTETMRIDGGLNFDEFRQALGSVLASSAAIGDVVQRAAVGKASRQEWQKLAWLSWGQLDAGSFDEARLLTLRLDMLDHIPVDLTGEKTALGAALLLSAAGARTESGKKAAALVRERATPVLQLMLGSAAGRRRARAAIIQGAAIVAWLAPEKGPAARRLRQRWLEAAQLLANDPALSVDSRLWTVYPALQFHSQEYGEDAPVPEALRRRVEAAVALADREATTKNTRNSVISGAAWLLSLAGSVDKARLLLQKELQSTATPWYYQSALAGLEKRAGNAAAARRLYGAARRSARGNATRLQWLVRDLLFRAQGSYAGQDQEVPELLDQYYALVFSLEDGFSGRNARGAGRVAKGLGPWVKKDPVQKVLLAREKDCRQLAARAKEKCLEHFKAIRAAGEVATR